MPAVLKTAERKRSVSSNLTSSANVQSNYQTAVGRNVRHQIQVVRICQVKGSVQQTKTLVLCKVLADKNDPVNYYDPYTLTLKPMCSILRWVAIWRVTDTKRNKQ